MKKLTLNLLCIFSIVSASAQTPQALNYQAIARNSLGQIVPSQTIGVRFTIQDATGNTTYYQETHTTTTNNFGLFTLGIGKGTAVSGAMAPIDWSAGGDKFLKVEIAPQGGTNYTIQGTTQLLSVPYALYAEKTRLIAGNAITITNGNTINASYVAGSGITINGNIISANAWLLTGNAGTTSSNFLGTTDNLPLNIRTNNLQRLSISESNVVGSNNISYILAGQQSNFSTNPVQLSVYGKDISGYMLPFGVAASVAGMNWSSSGGSNNTLGRLMRLSQFTSTSGNNYQFFDVGIDQGGSYFIGEHQFWNDGNVVPRKMITISPQNFVGINFNWGEDPTANFHTKGTLRFEGVNTNNALTRILAMDANGNVASRDASTLSGGGSGWLLTGNSGTTAANFLGTTDNLPLNIRTNNIQRLSISESNIASGHDITYITAGQQSNFSTNPVQLGVWGKDIVGYALPFGIASSIQGQTFGVAAGNTLGRLARFSQWLDPSGNNYQYYDIGMDQEGDFYFGEHALWSAGPFFPKKMIQISTTDNVGINLDWNENPTANFHTKGTARFQNIATNNTFSRILAMDANGNVASRDASTFSQWQPDANGIHYSTGNAGIGANSNTNAVFNVMGNSSFPYTAEINSTNTWQSSLNLFNSTSTWKWYMVTGGSANNQLTYGVGAGNFGIAKENTSSPNTTFPIIIASDDKVGIGMGLGGSNNVPKAQLHVKTGDVYIEQIGSGVIMKSPDGQCWRMTVSNAGIPVFTAITCP